MKWKDSHHPYALVTVLCWALAYVLTRLALRHFSPGPLGFWRYFAASAILLSAVLTLRMRPPSLKNWKWFTASGGLGFFLYMVTFNEGSATVTAATASLVIAVTPMLTALLARLVYRERLSGLKWAATLAEFGGLAWLTLRNGVFSLNAGVLWLLAAALTLSAYNLLQRRRPRLCPTLPATAYSMLAGTLMLAVFAPEALAEARTAPPVQFLYLAALGVFPSAVAYLAWAKAFALAPDTASVSNYMFLTPFLAALMGFWLAGETLDRAVLPGGAMIMAGALLFNFSGRSDFPPPDRRNIR